ncbi:MAG TPA: hypothetical protein VJ873_06735, partial [bacterium]|nr:hypothetical protein [bacterium]
TPGQWKVKAIAFIFALLLFTGIWSTGILKKLNQGPNIPLPRETAGFTLGMTLDEVLQKYPTAKKKLRPFNNDPQFKIVTLKAEDGLSGATSADLLFYLPEGKLYFVSATWDGDGAKSIPLSDWAYQFRRWNKDNSGSAEPLGNDVTLKEWHFDDTHTEMVLRDLNYTSHIQRWQDIRDSSNDAAQAAFAKYRLEAGGS